ncbi:MAG TPA: tripartite tricarboxylate transporter substrate binding protein [Casimicrobiaceae bacterium]|nr:tripartite tricarboxylate transporter substrate binding protein [Casimicrobiaceae bacterium]
MRALWRGIALSLAAWVGLVPPAAAQPTMPRAIKIVVPFSAGGSNDVIARAIAAPLGARLGTTVIVENKGGAAGVIGAEAVAKSPRDGSVLLLTSSSFLTAAATQPQLPYDPLAAFAPVAMVGRGPMLLAVSSTTTYKTPAEVVAGAKAAPGALNYGTAGVGSIAHLTTELFDDVAKIRMTHVPYKGAANAAVDLAAGQIQVMISNYSTISPLMKAGKIRALAVTSSQPHASFPDLPPLATIAPGFSVDIWVGVFAPAGTPPAVVERLNQEINAIAASPELAQVLEPDGALPEAISPALFARRIRDELAQWKQIAAEHKIVAE